MATNRKNRIQVDITGDVTGLRKALNSATAQVVTFGKDVEKSLTTLGGQAFNGLTAGVAGIGVAVAASVGALYSLTSGLQSAGEKAREIENLARLAGMSSEAFQNAAYAAEQFGISQEKLADISKDVKDKLGDFIATGGGEFKDFFENVAKKVGLTAKSLQGLSGPDVLIAVKKAMDDANVSAEEQVFYLESIANDAAMLTPILENNGKAFKEQADRARELGVALNSIEIGNLMDAQRAIGNATALVGGLKEKVLASFAPAFTAAVNDMTRAATELDGGINGLAATIAGKLVDGISFAVEAVRFFYNGWSGLQLIAYGAVAGIVNGVALLYKGLRGLLAPLDILLTGLAKLGVIDTNPLDDFQKTLDGFGDFSAGEFGKLLGEIESTNRQFDKAGAKLDEYREKITTIPAEYKQVQAESKKAAEAMTSDTGSVKDEIKLVEGVWVNVYEGAKKASKDATASMLADIEKIKAASSEAFGGSSSVKVVTPGFRTGGDPFHGALPGFGGGDRRIIAVEDGEHVIRKEATAVLGHGFFQKYNSLNFLRSLPRFATGGPIGGRVQAVGGGPSPATIYNLNVSFSGSVPAATGQNMRDFARGVLAEIEKMHRECSR